jgi:hypothetical protein
MKTLKDMDGEENSFEAVQLEGNLIEKQTL